jgi:hypothetical protein
MKIVYTHGARAAFHEIHFTKETAGGMFSICNQLVAFPESEKAQKLHSHNIG